MTAPADCCPCCGTGPTHPDRVLEFPECVVGSYKCTKCRARWSCSWLLSALKEAA